jgi:hypothetical protein
LGLALALLTAAAWSLLAAPLEAAAARAEARAAALRHEGVDVGAAGTGVDRGGVDPAEVVAAYRDASEAQLALQALLDRQARAVGLAVEALRPTAPEAFGTERTALGDVAWVEATLSGDLQATLDLMSALDAERPLVLVRAFEIEAAPGESGGGARPDASLRLRLEAGRAWRAPGGAERDAGDGS